MKLIRFRIPRVHPSYGSPDLNPNMQAMCIRIITEALDKWNLARSNKYTLHTTKDALYVEFEHESAVSMFLMTWEPDKHSTHWKRITLVDTMDSTVDTSIDPNMATQALDDDIHVRLEILDERLRQL